MEFMASSHHKDSHACLDGDGRNPANQVIGTVVYTIFRRGLYIPGGAGFLPSTVLLKLILQMYILCLFKWNGSNLVCRRNPETFFHEGFYIMFSEPFHLCKKRRYDSACFWTCEKNRRLWQLFCLSICAATHKSWAGSPGTLPPGSLTVRP